MSRATPGKGAYCDLHCHLLYGLDDGAKTLEDSLEMARALVELGFDTVAASPHARPEYASRLTALARLDEVQQALTTAQIPLVLLPNAENFFLDAELLNRVGSVEARGVGTGNYLLVEAPYLAPVPALLDMVFQFQLKGVTPLIAHPERCAEFDRKGRAEEVVRAGACLQLDIGALGGRYGPAAKKRSKHFLDQDLYAVAATDLHSPAAAREWVARAIEDLQDRVGDARTDTLLSVNPRRILCGLPIENAL